MTTAIIVNSRGEVFVGWRSGCTIGVWGGETYYLSAEFQKTETVVRRDGHWWPWGSAGRCYRTIGKPYVFSSKRAAEAALLRMGGLGRAIVT